MIAGLNLQKQKNGRKHRPISIPVSWRKLRYSDMKT